MNKESLNQIREKVSKKEYDFRSQELLHLEEAYYELNMAVFKKKKVLDKSCSSCVITAVNQLYNYITYHEVEAVKPEKQASVVRVETIGVMGNLTRKQMIEECKKRNITIPRNATVSQLKELLS